MKFRHTAFAACVGLALAGLLPGEAFAAMDPMCQWTDTSKTPDQRALLLLDASTVDQAMRWLNEASANLVFDTVFSGATYPQQVPCVGFQADTDGPWGIAYTNGTTAFPVPVAQAASWDVELTWEKGQAMGDEAWRKQYNTLFAPGIDIVRHPWGGRNAEYLGEDPYLAGTLAGTWIKALRESIPDQPVAAVLKHFVGNQQELDRTSSSSNIDVRTLHEVYLLPYAIAFQEGQPAGVMCGFNQLNGVYTCENPTLLTTYLRDEMQFEGFAVTDNGAQHSTGASLLAGLSQELSQPLYFTPDKLHAALSSGEITEDEIRAAAFRVLRAKFANGLMDHPLPATGRDDDVRTAQHQDVARRMEEEGAVLLKNDAAFLPLRISGKTIAVIGPTASSTPTNGISNKTVCTSPLYGAPDASPVLYDCDGNAPLDAITTRAARDGNTVIFDDGSDLASAAKTAARADVVIVFGYNRIGEFYDLQTLNLHSDGDALIEAVAGANPHTVVVLETAGAVLMPWLDQVPAVMEAWWPGEAGGDALAELLFGDVNPSGKLPVTFMKALSDLPTGGVPNAQYPGVFADGSTTRAAGSSEIRQVNYTEALQVGYKWYDQRGITPLFAFGHGLSYTTFGYSNIVVRPTGQQGNAATSYTVGFTVTNTGQVAGAEVPQVYLTFPDAAGEPGKRLVGFNRISLAPGEARHVEIPLDSGASNRPFSVWDVNANTWKAFGGDYLISVGASSRDLRLEKSATVLGDSSTQALANGAAQTGVSGYAGTSAFYKIVVPAGARNLVIRTFGGSGDVSLQVKAGTRPSDGFADYTSARAGNAESVVIARPAAGTYFIRVRGVKDSQGLSVQASFVAP